MMGKRILVGAALIAFMCALLWLDWKLEELNVPQLPAGPAGRTRLLRGLPLAALVAVLLAAGYLELARLAAAAGTDVFRLTGLAATVLVGTLPFWRQAAAVGPHGEMLTKLLLGGTLMVFFADQVIHHGTKDVIRRIGASLLGVCYLGVCGAIVLGIRLEFGLRAFVFFLVAVKATDIGAYFSGSFFGRHKLLPRLSPGKSWEGLLGGLVAAAACGVGTAAVLNPIFANDGKMVELWLAGALAVALGLFGQMADMCESALKRDAGRKDSGGKLPAFGGVLDVVDSPLLAAPAAYLLLALAR